MAKEKQIQTDQQLKEIEVYDSDKKKLVRRSVDDQRLSFALHNSIIGMENAKAMILKRILDEKRYLDFHCNNFEQYCELYLDMGDRQARKYIRAARRFEGIGLDVTAIALQDGKSSEQSSEQNRKSTSGLDLGIEKWDMLFRQYDDEDLKGLIDGKELIASDGQKYSLEEIKLMSRKEAMITFMKEKREEEKAKEKRYQRVEEDNKLLKKENESMKTEHEYAFELEKKYGPNARRLQEKIECMNKAYRCLSDFNRYLAQAHVEIDDPLEVIERLQAIVRSVEIFREHLLPKYGGIVNELLSDSKANKY